MECKLFVILLGISAISNLPRGSIGCEQNATRLVGGQNKFEGRVEVCQDGEWKTVCNSQWNLEEAQVVCRQLGFAEDARTERVNLAARFFGNATASQAIISQRWGCSGDERELLSCPRVNRTACGHGRDAGVYCYGRTYDRCQEGELRLANNGSRGRVEVCLDDFWGTVCDDGWDVRDATTVCRQLGLSDRGVPTRRALFGEGTGPVHLSRAECTSEDMNLLGCAIDDSAVNGCDHSEDAGVICNGPSSCSDGEVRLMGGENELEGRVEICYNGVWGTVCDNGWDETDATVVCKQLGFGYPGIPVNMSLRFGAGLGPVLLSNVACNRSHLELLQCVHPLSIGIHNCDQQSVAGVVCPSGPATTTAVNTPPSTSSLDLLATNTQNIGTSKSGTTVQSATIFGAVGGAVGGALAMVVLVAIVLIVVVTAVVIVTRRRKPNHRDATGKGALDNLYDNSASVGAANLDGSSGQEEVDHGGDEREFENPLYSDTGPPCYPNTTNQPVTEREYGELYSDCTMTGEALYTQNNVVQGTLTSAYANTLASGVIYGNSVPPTLEGIDEDTCTYSALGLTELNHPTPHDQSQTVLENEYSCLQHK